jgi:hypothetical protein
MMLNSMLSYTWPKRLIYYHMCDEPASKSTEPLLDLQTQRATYQEWHHQYTVLRYDDQRWAILVWLLHTSPNERMVLIDRLSVMAILLIQLVMLSQRLLMSVWWVMVSCFNYQWSLWSMTLQPGRWIQILLGLVMKPYQQVWLLQQQQHMNGQTKYDR